MARLTCWHGAEGEVGNINVEAPLSRPLVVHLRNGCKQLDSTCVHAAAWHVCVHLYLLRMHLVPSHAQGSACE